MKSEKTITMVIVFCFAVLTFVGGLSAMDSSPYIFDIGPEIIPGSLSYQEVTGIYLIQPSDLEYMGAFRLPGESGESSWEYSGAAMAYYPGGDPSGPADGYPGSIFAVGHDWQMYVSEISIPVPVISSTKNPDDLNTATTLQEFHDVRAGLFDPLVEIIRVGMEYLPAQGGQTSDKLYFAWGQHNQGEGAPELIPSHMWCELNLSNPDTAGPWWAGDCPTSISIYSVNDYIFEIPGGWAAINTPGNLLATGRFRDGGWSGQGPSIYAIGPWNDGNPPAQDTRLNATTLLHYDSSYIEDGNTMSDYHHSDEWSGGAWLTSEDKSAVIFVGTKGTGDCWYGCADGTDEPPWPDDCDRGWWSTGFEGQIIFYDPADLAAVARGEMETWEPQPYASLNIDQYLYNVKSTQQKYHVRAMSFDRARGLLYVFEPLADGDKSLVHVWSVKDRDTNITFWTERSTVKIRPFDSPGGEQSIHIKAAKNEYEAFQVAVTAPEGLTDVNVSVSDLTGSGGSISREYIRLYREAYMNIITPSNIEGERGLWPDALIPTVDPFFDETRNAFPFDVPAGQNRAIWVDVFVPPTTNAGAYTGNLTITASGKNPALVPITLTVWNFTLPSTSSLISAFGFDGWELLVGHYGNHDHHDQIVPLSKLYAENGLMHRISLETVTQEDWSILPWPATDPIDWTEFDANWSPFLDGIDLPYGPHGARLTSLMISTCGDTDEERVVYWQHYVSHFKDKGWFDRLFDYSWDEPHEPDDFVELKKRAYLINQADPDLRVLVTTNIKYGQQYDLIGIVDMWVPIINEMHDKPGEVCWYSPYAGNQRDQYNELLAAGNELWWYQSCMSHGCYEIGGECYSGWPSYMIDIPAIYNRIMSWQSFKYNISGELYFSTNYAFEFNDYGSKDPWNNQYYFGGNGDGTLFYPGRPDRIGGTHHIPIESIRLKMIREGMEDYEYMNMLQDRGYESFAKSQVDLVVTNAYTFSHDPAALYTARENMARQILAHGITYYVSPTGDDSNPGTIDQPWRTIQHAADVMVAGDTVLIRNGTYNEQVHTVNSGNATDGYIVFSAYLGETPVIDGTGVTTGNTGFVVADSYIKLIGLEICNWDDTGIWIENAGHIEISDCEVHNVWFGIGAADGTHDFVLNRVEMHNFTLYGFDASPSGGVDCYNGTFNDCIAHTARDPEQNVDGFALGHGTQHDFVFNRCEVYDVYDGFDISARNTTLNRCSAHDCWSGGYKIWQDNVTLVNCLSYHNEVSNVELDWDGEPGTTTLQNCNFVDAQVYNIWVENAADHLHMYNCILAGGDNIGLAFEQRNASNYQGDYNIFHNDNPDRAIAVGYTDEFSLNQIATGSWTNYSGQDQHSLVSFDPNSELFKNLNNWDLHLVEGSIAIDAGTPENAPSVDYDDVIRPQSNGYDIGAYEYSNANNQSIINHTCTNLSQIPEEWITTAKDTFRVWYGHTSHGSQITSGMDAMYSDLYSFNTGDEIIPGSLSYQEETGVDLGHEGDLTWRDITVAQLNQPDNDRNVVMWSWCGGVFDNTEAGINTYLNAMNQLEIDYPNVAFIYMTGHLDGTGESGNLNIRNNQIRDYCKANEKILFDFADIESYDPDGNYYLDLQANDNCDYFDGSKWRNWAIEWCDVHPGECSSCECAHSQSLNCDLKARAFWWMMARVAGWKPTTATYYVAPTGDDSNPGTISQPWRTIQHAAETLVAGDTVLIRNGVYNEQVSTMHDGDATDGYLVFSAYTGETPIIDGNGVTEANDGFIVDKSYIKLIGLEIRNWNDNGIWIENAGHIEISDCVVHDVGNGIGAADGTHDFELNRVEMHHFDIYGFDASPYGADCYNGTFNDCIAHTGRDPTQNVDGFALGHGTQHDFTFNRCKAYDVYDGFDVGENAGSQTKIVLNRCSAYDCWNDGYKLTGQGKLVNCLSYHNSNANVGLYWGGNAGTTTLHSCTFMDTEVFNIWVENSTDSLHMYNCILAGGDNIGLAFEQRDASNYKGDYNVFHNDNPDRAIAVGYEDEFSLEHIAAGDWAAYSGQDAHSLVAFDPDTQLFRNLSAWDLHLREGSIAIDAGTSQGAPSEDYDGNPRPQGAGYDIGCYEFISTPDLVITHKWLCRPDKCTICYNVTNIGSGTAPACHNTTLYVDGVAVAHDHVPVDIAPGEGYVGCFDGYTWTYTPPSDNITVCADNYETLVELDEDNNCVTNIWMCGDVNCDGKVTMSDVRKVFNRYLDPNYPLDSPWAADVNCDDEVTMSDVRKVFNRYLDPGYELNCC